MNRNKSEKKIDRSGGLYIHVPFCLSKCDYCGFYSVLPKKSLVEEYLQHLAEEAATYRKRLPADFATVFVGGGNPTSIGIEGLQRLVDAVYACVEEPVGLREWTFESNPETLTAEIVAYLAKLPSIRLSIGIQRLDDRELAILGRQAVMASVERALDLVFSQISNVSGDFIMGVPECPSLADDLYKLVQKYPFTHISAYFLTVEEDTPLQKAVLTGQITDPTEIGPEELYEVRQALSLVGFEHYEISNYARCGFRCQHNLNYWTQGDYVGLGPAAVSCIQGHRSSNVADLRRWLAGEEAAVENLSAIDRRNEYLMLRLRLLTDGLNLSELERRFGAQPEVFNEQVCRQTDLGNLLRNGECLRLSDVGLKIADEVMAELFL
jgi:oxygen-independent coproporphyrinogen-3 oxidase